MAKNEQLASKEVIINTSICPTRTFEELSAIEQKKVSELYEKLEDYSDASLIDFTSEAAENSAREAEDFLRTTKINDLTDFNECMTDLTRELRSIDTKTLSEINPSPLAKIPLIGAKLAESALGKKVESVIERQKTVQSAVNSTVETLEGIKITLREDLIRCGVTREKTVEYAKQLEYEYLALYQKRMELEERYKEISSSENFNQNSLDTSEYLVKISDGIQTIERKMDNVLRYRINAIQNIPSLALVKNTENAIINSIDDCVKNVIPEWNKAFLQAILAYRVLSASKVMGNVQKATNEIILKAAETTSEAIISAAEIVERPHIATETLEKKTQIFIETCNEIVNIAKDASMQRMLDAERLKNIEVESIRGSSERKKLTLEKGGEVKNE